MAKGIVIDIGFTSDIKKYIATLERELQSVDFDKLIGLSSSFDKEYKKLSELVKVIRTELDRLSETDVSKISSQMMTISNTTDKLVKAFSLLATSLPKDIQSKMGIANITKELSEMSGVCSEAAVSINDLKQAASGNISIVDKDEQNKLIELYREIKSLLSLIESPRKNGGYTQPLTDLQKILDEIIKQYHNLTEASDAYNQISSGAKKGNINKALSVYTQSLEKLQALVNFYTDINPSGVDKIFPPIQKSISGLSDFIDDEFERAEGLLKERLAKLQEVGLKKAGIDLASYFTQSERKGEEPIRVSLALAKGSRKSLYNQVIEIIGQVQNDIVDQPLKIEVKLVSAYQSKANQASIKEIQNQIYKLEQQASHAGSEAEAIKITTISKNLSQLIDRMNRQIDNAMMFTVNVETERAIGSVQRFVSNAKKELEELKKSVVISPTFTIEPEQINQIKSDMVNAFTDKDNSDIKTTLIDTLINKIKDVSTSVQQLSNSLKNFVEKTFDENIILKAESLNVMYTQLLMVNEELDIFIKGIRKLDNKTISQNMLAMAAEQSQAMKAVANIVRSMLSPDESAEIELLFKNKDQTLETLAQIKQEMLSIFDTSIVEKWEKATIDALLHIKTSAGINLFNTNGSQNSLDILSHQINDIIFSDQFLRKVGTYAEDYTDETNIIKSSVKDFTDAFSNYMAGLVDEKEYKSIIAQMSLDVAQRVADAHAEYGVKMKPREHSGVLTRDLKVLGLSAGQKEGSSYFRWEDKYPELVGNILSRIHSHAGDIVWMPSVSDLSHAASSHNTIPFDTTIAEKEIAVTNNARLSEFVKKYGDTVFDTIFNQIEDIINNKNGHSQYNKLLNSKEFNNFKQPYVAYRDALMQKGVAVDIEREERELKKRFLLEHLLKTQYNTPIDSLVKLYSPQTFAQSDPYKLGLNKAESNSSEQLSTINNTLQEILAILRTLNGKDELDILQKRLIDLNEAEARIKNGKGIYTNRNPKNTSAWDRYIDTFNGDLFDAKRWGKIQRQTKRNEDPDSANQLIQLAKEFKTNPSGKIVENALSIINNSKLPETLKQSLVNYINRIKTKSEEAINTATQNNKPEIKTKKVTMSRSQYENYIKTHPEIMPHGPEGAFKGNFERHLQELEKKGLATRTVDKSGKLGRYKITVEITDLESESQTKTDLKLNTKKEKPIKQNLKQAQKQYTDAEQAELNKIEKERKIILARISELQQSETTSQNTNNAFSNIEKISAEKINKLIELCKVLNQIKGGQTNTFATFIDSISKLPQEKNPVLEQLENIVKNKDAIIAVNNSVKSGKALATPKSTKQDAAQMLSANEAGIRSTATNFISSRLGIPTAEQIKTATKAAQNALRQTWSNYSIANNLVESGGMEESVAKEYAQAFVDTYIEAIRDGLQVKLTKKQSAFLQPMMDEIGKIIPKQHDASGKFFITDIKAMQDGLVHVTALVKDANGEYEKLTMTYKQAGQEGEMAVESIQRSSAITKAGLAEEAKVAEQVEKNIIHLGHVDLGTAQWAQLQAKLEELGISLENVDQIIRQVDRDGFESFRIFDSLGNVKTVGMDSDGFLFIKEFVTRSRNYLESEFRKTADDIPKILDKAFKGDENATAKLELMFNKIRDIFADLRSLPQEMMSNEDLGKLGDYFAKSFGTAYNNLDKINIKKMGPEFTQLLNDIQAMLTTIQDAAANGGIESVSNQIDALSNAFLELGKAVKPSKGQTIDSLNKLLGNKVNKDLLNTAMPRALRKEYLALRDEMEAVRDQYASGGVIPDEVFSRLNSHFIDLHNRLIETGKLGSSMGDKITRSLKNSIISVARMYLSWYRWIAYIRQGIQEVTNLDTALTKMSYTMNISNTQLQNMSKEMVSMAKDLSTSVENISQIYQIYANLQTTQEELEKTARPTAILANLSGVDASTAADQLQGVLNQFKLTADDADHIVDVYDKISASIKVDYSKGIAGMADAVKNVGNFANEAGMSFEQLAAIVGRVMQQTRMEGGQIGVSLKTNKLSRCTEMCIM